MPDSANVPDRVETDRLLPPPVVAQLLGVQVGTLQVWRSRRQGPPYIVLSRRAVRYPAAALRGWLESCRTGSRRRSPETNEPGR